MVTRRTVADHLEWVDPEKMTTAPNGSIVSVLKDNWWPVDSLGRIPFWVWRGGRSPQCNANRWIVERLSQPEGAVGIVQIPLILVPVNPRDY